MKNRFYHLYDDPWNNVTQHQTHCQFFLFQKEKQQWEQNDKKPITQVADNGKKNIEKTTIGTIDKEEWNFLCS